MYICTLKHTVARMLRLYKTYWIDNWIYWITHNYSVYTSQLTIAAATLLWRLLLGPNTYS
jgi:hypothetical protein